ncbi:MAG: hypothetical protein ACUVWO_01695 [Thermodesulfobacteriota bacterium]
MTQLTVSIETSLLNWVLAREIAKPIPKDFSGKNEGRKTRDYSSILKVCDSGEVSGRGDGRNFGRGHYEKIKPFRQNGIDKKL